MPISCHGSGKWCVAFARERHGECSECHHEAKMNTDQVCVICDYQNNKNPCLCKDNMKLLNDEVSKRANMAAMRSVVAAQSSAVAAPGVVVEVVVVVVVVGVVVVVVVVVRRRLLLLLMLLELLVLARTSSTSSPSSISSTGSTSCRTSTGSCLRNRLRVLASRLHDAKQVSLHSDPQIRGCARWAATNVCCLELRG